MKKKISIIIPTFNSERFIEQCIKSILLQSYNNWEIIVCDNESNDNTIQLIKSLVKEDKRIKISKKKDSGVAEALNTGFKLATGDILCWLNSDDIYMSGRTLEIVNQNINKKFDFVNSNFLNIDSENKVIKSFYSYIPNYKIKTIFYFNQIFTGSFFFTRKVLENFKGFRHEYKYSFEYEIIIYCLKNFRGIHVNKFLSCFRILPNALSSNKKDLHNEFINILNKENLKYSNSFIYRIFGMIVSKNLHLAVLNKIFDNYRGKKI